MILETPRLIIKPLSEQELMTYLLPDNSLEKSLRLQLRPRVVNDRIQKNIKTNILPVFQDPDKNYKYFTFWTVIDKEQKLIVAEFCFKGAPNAQGTLEIGYGTYPDFQKKGLMTEVLGAMIQWAFQQKEVKTIIAHTDPGNIASQRVLEKNNFYKQVEDASNICWRREKNSTIDQQPPHQRTGY